MTKICGIDEAGRGPIIGPMVLCGFVMDDSDEKTLNEIGVTDSKLILKEKRERLFESLKKFKHEIVIMDPLEVDNAVNGQDGLNLNRLEAKRTIEILNKLNPDKAIIDAVGQNTQRYKEHLSSFIKNKNMALIVEHKADLNHKVVGAASIIAKVTRDREIEKIKKKIGVDFGSGYLADPKTAKFLEEYPEKYKDIFRHSWAPYKERISKKFQSSLNDFSKYEEKDKSKNIKLIKNIKKLEKLGYKEIPVCTEHEELRMKGDCMVTLYKKGTLLIQGKNEEKERIKKFLDKI